ncbi:hypothetical protein EJD97_010645 [Solanum chilense]|uniref:CCHC-type domain-containing protein n=1 Tax=Solanum chilense TaxID=4083 RepID=A0A6N2CCD3_SOLCI|nr:hypothetical protein EJD97_010645 [Solanum chilense]
MEEERVNYEIPPQVEKVEKVPRDGQGVQRSQGDPIPNLEGDIEVPEISNREIREVFIAKARAATIQSKLNMISRVLESTKTSSYRDFVRMDPPIFLGSKVNEDPQEFLDEVYKLLRSCFSCDKKGNKVRDCPMSSFRGREGKQVAPSVPKDDASKKRYFYALRLDWRKRMRRRVMSMILCFIDFYVFVLDEIYVRGVKLIEYSIRLGNAREIIPNDHPRVLEEGPKPVCKAVQGRPQTTEQSMARRPFDAPSMGFVDGDLEWGKEDRLCKSLNPSTVASMDRQ